MNRLKFVLLLCCAMLLVVVPVIAQEDEPVLGPGEGAPVVFGNFGGDIATLNPLLVTDQPSQDVVNQLFPVLISGDPDSGLPIPGADGALATDWSFSEDGRVMTITLRDDMVWNDGTPITSADILYSYEAIMSGEIDSPLNSFISPYIESLETPDEHTVVITFFEPDCSAVYTALNIPPVPAHFYQEAYPSFADMNASSEFNFRPEVSSGPFQFQNFRAGEQVTLLDDQNYPDSSAGHVVPEGWVYKNVADQLVETEQFLAGTLTIMQSVPDDREAELIERANNGEFQMYRTPSVGWQMVIFNFADPENPQPGLNDDGNVIPQDPHPIFGDVRVRQAFAHAINHEALNQGAFSGTGLPVGGMMNPQSWAYNEDLAPYAFDPELAMQLLDEAGFVDDDSNPDTPRVASEDALYAEPGTVLEFDLSTFSGNLAIDSGSVLMQDQLGDVGFQVNLDVLEFTPLLEKLDGQVFDAVMLFWGVTPARPGDMYDMLAVESDLPAAGLNGGSYYNAEFESTLLQARTLPGCDQAERKELYDRAQQIVYDELPYYLVNTSVVTVLVQNSVSNFDPRPNGITWNMPAWSIQP